MPCPLHYERCTPGLSRNRFNVHPEYAIKRAERFDWVNTLGLLAAAAALLLSGCRPQEDRPAPPAAFKHVVFIVGDDHTTTALGAYGNGTIRTPHLDALAARGVRFNRAYAAAPICSASRQSLLTGKYPHATGVNLLFTPFPDAGNVTVAEHLGAYGFRSAMIGKNHFNHWIWRWGDLYEGGTPTHGFDLTVDKATYREWLKERNPPPVDSIPTRANQTGEGVLWGKNARVLPEGVREADAEGTYFVRRALDFMEEHRAERLCIWLAFHEPHAPFAFPAEYAGRHDPGAVPLPRGGAEDQQWVPEQFRNLTDNERRGIVAAYYTSVEYLDANVGRLMTGLDQMGLRDSTLVVYLGDQGYLLNEHDRFEKHTFWEESVTAPLIMSGPGLPEGKVSDALVSFVDIVPTAVELLRIPAHADFQGESVLGVLTSPDTATGREYVFSEYLHDNMAMVATRDWKYVFATGKRDLTIGYATGRGASGLTHRLYDLRNDPKETTNLADAPEQKTR
ncbi:MAG: sulfatase-like hydrolase/transferase, partial [Catalinimonas sp.]